MIKFLAGIAYEQNRPMGVASALIAKFGFLVKSALKICCTTIFSRQKLLQITIHNFSWKIFFDRSTGLASALTAKFGFLTKSALKMCCTKFFFFTEKVVANEKPQVLCYVTFFDSLRHFGVIAASQIVYVVCVEKVLCRLTEQIFFFFWMFVCLFVDTITHERLNQFEPNFHT